MENFCLRGEGSPLGTASCCKSGGPPPGQNQGGEDRQDEGGVDHQVKPGGAAPTQRPPGNCLVWEKKAQKKISYYS